MRRALAFAVSVLGCALSSGCHPTGPHEVDQAEVDQAEDAKAHHLDPLGPNTGCYVCHMTFVGEELAKTHLKADVGCVECHGTSAAHANDENIGATPPDVVIKGEKLNPFCRKCHPTHDVAPERIIARWLERAGPNATSQPAQSDAQCTACHGHHKINESL